MNNANGRAKCWLCGLPEPFLALVKHADGKMHWTRNDCAEAAERVREKTAARVAELKALSESEQ